MKEAIIEKLYNQLYKAEMSISEYLKHLQEGLDLMDQSIKNLGAEASRSLHLALEYNRELMMQVLLSDARGSNSDECFPFRYRIA